MSCDVGRWWLWTSCCYEGSVATLEGDAQALEEVTRGGGSVFVAAPARVAGDGIEVGDGAILPSAEGLHCEGHEVDADSRASLEIAGHFPLFGGLESCSRFCCLAADLCVL